MHRLQVGEIDSTGWYHAVSTEGSYQVKIPIPFNDFTVAATGDDGQAIPTYSVGSKGADGVKFSVIEAIRSSGIKELTAESYLEQMAATVGVAPADVKYGNYLDGRDVKFRLEARRGVINSRAIFLSDRTILMTVEGPFSATQKIDELSPTFFESLKPKP